MSVPVVQNSRKFQPYGASVLRRMALERQVAAQELGRNLARHRVRLNLTQEDAAKRIGVTHRAYQRWESGESMPYPRNVKLIADAFGVELGEVYTDAVSESELSGRLDGIDEKLEAILGGQNAIAAALQTLQEGRRSSPARASKRRTRAAG